jgi:hypothetical protein
VGLLGKEHYGCGLERGLLVDGLWVVKFDPKLPDFLSWRKEPLFSLLFGVLMEAPPLFYSMFTVLYVIFDKAATTTFKGFFGSASGTSSLLEEASRVRSSILMICMRYSAIVSKVLRNDLDP